MVAVAFGKLSFFFTVHREPFFDVFRLFNFSAISRLRFVVLMTLHRSRKRLARSFLREKSIAFVGANVSLLFVCR